MASRGKTVLYSGENSVLEAYPRGPPNWPYFVPRKRHFLVGIIGYDRLKLYRKIYTPKMKSLVRTMSRTLKTDAISIQSVVLSNLVFITRKRVVSGCCQYPANVIVADRYPVDSDAVGFANARLLTFRQIFHRMHDSSCSPNTDYLSPAS